MTKDLPTPTITIDGVDLSTVYLKSSAINDTCTQNATKDGLCYGPDTVKADGDELAKALGHCTITVQTIQRTHLNS